MDWRRNRSFSSPVALSRTQAALEDPCLQTHHLISEEEDRLDGKLSIAKVEEVLEAGAQQLHHHDVVVALLPKPLDLRDALCRWGEGCGAGGVRRYASCVWGMPGCGVGKRSGGTWRQSGVSSTAKQVWKHEGDMGGV